jgi:serine palmitoyltransferase
LIQLIDGIDRNYMKIRGVKLPVLDLCTFDFLGMSKNNAVKEASKAALEVYGCGSCGPRGFYGTIDQHLKVEVAIAEFMGTQVRYLQSFTMLPTQYHI